MDRGAWQATVHKVAESQTEATEQARSRPVYPQQCGLRGGEMEREGRRTEISLSSSPSRWPS